MGYLNSDWMKNFCIGKTIASIDNLPYHDEIHFTDGTHIRLSLEIGVVAGKSLGSAQHKSTIEFKHYVLVTPFAGLDVVQSIEISEGQARERVARAKHLETMAQKGARVRD